MSQPRFMLFVSACQAVSASSLYELEAQVSGGPSDVAQHRKNKKSRRTDRLTPHESPKVPANPCFSSTGFDNNRKPHFSRPLGLQRARKRQAALPFGRTLAGAASARPRDANRQLVSLQLRSPVPATLVESGAGKKAAWFANLNHPAKVCAHVCGRGQAKENPRYPPR